MLQMFGLILCLASLGGALVLIARSPPSVWIWEKIRALHGARAAAERVLASGRLYGLAAAGVEMSSPGPGWSEVTLVGPVNGLETTLQTYALSRIPAPLLRTKAYDSGHEVLSQIRVVADARSFLSPKARAEIVRDAETGAFRNDGSSWAAAVLDDRLLKALPMGTSLKIERGRIQWTGLFHRGDSLQAPLEMLSGIARRLGGPNAKAGASFDVRDLLTENVETSRNAGVRARSIRALASVLGDEIDASSAFAKAITDSSSRVRLAAAKGSRVDRLEVVRDVLLDSSSEASVRTRTQALHHLMKRYGSDTTRVVPILEDVVRSQNRVLAPSAVRSLGKLRYRPAITLFASLKNPSPTLKTSMAQVIELLCAPAEPGDPADPVAIGLMLSFLESPETNVKVAAARALAVIGNVACIASLRAAILEDSGPFFAPPETLAFMVRHAIKSIQARTGDGAGGELAVATLEDTQGRVSLDEARGTLAEANQED
ncbi:MAG: hypothetical protein H6729_02755 [Deltaproteobacteria bacterium]|nr:hypothetical protein [Deltaproteobacteria bacterium]